MLPPADSYLRLVRAFPLRPLRNEREYDAAVKIMNRLAIRDEGTLDAGEQDYLDAITTFVAAYDEQHYPIDTSDVKPLELLTGLMEQRGMSVSDLGRVIGSQPAASMIVNGKRGISRSQAKAIAAHFGIDAGAFI